MKKKIEEEKNKNKNRMKNILKREIVVPIKEGKTMNKDCKIMTKNFQRTI
jgi:hypothetical protein